jgi:hypothetical protein
VRVLEYDTASADNIAADFAAMMAEHVASAIVVSRVHGQRFKSRCRLSTSRIRAVFNNEPG